MNRGEPESDPLEGALGGMRSRLGECPDTDALARFAAGSLQPEEASRIRSHVSLCGVCDSLVERLRDFDEPGAGGAAGWAAANRRIRSKVFPKPRWWMLLLHPAFAYGIAVLAVGGAVAVAVSGRHAGPARPTLP